MDNSEQARRKICLALDEFQTLADIRACVEELQAVVGLFKIGKELFTRFGPEVVRLVHGYGADVFLDLKFHDIPNTVKGAAYAATQLGVYLFNVHAAGGQAMLAAARAGAAAASAAHNLRQPKIIAVTVLTSIDQATMNHDLRVPGTVGEQVLHFAQLTAAAGLDGIVCAAADLRAIRHALPADFLYVTPGIQWPATAAGNDQKRVYTPRAALQDGASILVIGRAITAAPDRRAAAQAILAEMAG